MEELTLEQKIRNKVAEEIEEVYKWAKTPEIRAIADECADIARYGIEYGVGE